MKKIKTFPGVRPDEEIILLLRRHWRLIIGYILRLAISGIVPIIIYLLLFYTLNLEIEEGGLIYIILILGASIYYLFIWALFFHEWIDYYLDVWIVTNRRILNIEQEGFFNRTISEQNIERVQDVTSEVKGRLETFLDFGDVYVQTAGEEKRFVFEQIPHPYQVAEKIIEIHNKVAREKKPETPPLEIKASQINLTEKAKENENRKF